MRTRVIVIGLVGLGISYQLGKRSVPKAVVRNCEEMVVKNEVITAVSLLSVMDLKYEQGEIGLSQTRQIAKELVEGLRYGNNRKGKFIVEELGKATGAASFSMDYVPFGWRVRTEGGL